MISCAISSRLSNCLGRAPMRLLWDFVGAGKAKVVNSRQNNSRDQALQQASLALRTQQFSRAEQLVTGVLKSNRTDRSAVLILAHALIAQNRQGEAIVPLEKALRRSSDPEVETLLGAALCGSRRSVDGIEQLRRTAARRPPYLPAFQELAGQLAKTGLLNDAIRTVEDGLALAPESIDLKVELGRLLLQNNDRAKARNILIVARDAARGRPDILAELARTLLFDGEYAAAADAFRHGPNVRNIVPDQALAWTAGIAAFAGITGTYSKRSIWQRNDMARSSKPQPRPVRPNLARRCSRS